MHVLFAPDDPEERFSSFWCGLTNSLRLVLLQCISPCWMGGLCSDFLTCLDLDNHVTLRCSNGNIKSCLRISCYHKEHQVFAVRCKEESHYFSKYLGLKIQRLCIIHIFLSCICQQILFSLHTDQKKWLHTIPTNHFPKPQGCFTH